MTDLTRRNYKVVKLKGGETSPAAKWLDGANKAVIDNYPWGPLSADDFRPKAEARVAHDDQSLYVYMETDDNNLRAQTQEFGHVHTDCCMEFFLSPAPESSQQYINWEFNPVGGMYLSIGTSRFDRVPIIKTDYRELFRVSTESSDRGWNLEITIPLSFLQTFFPSLELKAGHEMKGNFYKCGDQCPRPHYGCWSPIDPKKLAAPDFHCPIFFGTLTLD